MGEDGAVLQFDDYPDLPVKDNNLDGLEEGEVEFISLHELISLLEGKQQ